jgi:hypothetical protein
VPKRLLPPLALVGLGLLFFADLVAHPGQVLYSDYSDILAQHIPAKRFLVRSWQQTGELPLWCPYRFGGEPFVADIQVGAFYPPHFLLYALPEKWVGVGVSWLIVAHVLLAGLAMYAYARDQGLGRAGAFVAASGFMFAGKWLLHLLGGGHYITIGLAWLPLALLCLERAVRRRRLRWATAAGLVFGLLALGTQPQWTFYAGILLALWTFGTVLECAGVWDGGQSTEYAVPSTQYGVQNGKAAPAPHWVLGTPYCVLSTAYSVVRTPWFRRWLLYGLWAALLAGGLAAVQVLPTLEAARESTRSAGVDAGDLLRGGLRSLIFVAGPSQLAEPANLMWEDRGGFGLLWLAAAALAPTLCRGRVRYQAAVCVALFAFAFGGSVLFQGLPGFSLFRQHARMLLVAALPVAYLAGVATHALATLPEVTAAVRSRCRHVAGRVLAGLALLTGAFALRLWLGHQGLRFHVYWVALLMTAPVAFWLLTRTGLTSRPRWALAWSAVLVADLWALAWPLVAVRPEAQVYARPGCVDYLAARAAEHGRVLDRDAAGPGETGPGTGTPLGTGGPQAMLCGLESLRGYNPLDNRRYKEYLQFVTGEDRPLRPLEGPLTFPVLSNFPLENKPLLDLLGTRYLLAPVDQPPARQAALARAGAGELPLPAAQEALEQDGWRKVAEDDRAASYDFIAGGVRPLPRYAVYENTRALPRAFVVPHAAPLPDRPRVLQALTTTDFRDTVLLEGAPPAADPCAAGSTRDAVIEQYLPNRVAVRVAGDAPGYLVLTDAWYPGWGCTVDGTPAALYRADFLFRAVPVPAGEHEVVFTFVPRSYHVGRLITGLALVLAGVALLLAGLRELRFAVGQDSNPDDRGSGFQS